MAFIVEMARGRADSPNFEEYSCGAHTWRALLALGAQFGWQPAGTLPVEPAERWTSKYMACFEPTYDPEEWAYCKRIGDEDARNLASALRAAAASLRSGLTAIPKPDGPTLLSDRATARELSQANLPPAEGIDKFVAFLEGGEFTFA